MARIRIYPYKMGSRSATALKEELARRGHNVLKVRPDGAYNPRATDVVLNWGSSTLPRWNTQGLLNACAPVGAASNKLRAFDFMREGGNVSIPEFTTDKEVADGWVQEGPVVGREVLTGHSGRGVVMFLRGEDIRPNIPMYVKYIKKAAEYRVHVFKGQVIDVQQKRKRNDVPREEVNFQVRNHENGWVFCRENVEAPASVTDNAISAVDALGLDFGAVDVIWNEHHQRAYVLEVNTAPGLEGTTLTNYADAIENIL